MMIHDMLAVERMARMGSAEMVMNVCLHLYEVEILSLKLFACHPVMMYAIEHIMRVLTSRSHTAATATVANL